MRPTGIAATLAALLGALALATAAAGAAPGAGGPAAASASASPTAGAAARCAKRGKGRAKGRPKGKPRKRCRGKTAPAPVEGATGLQPAGPPARLLVTQREYSLQLSRPSVPAGTVIVEQYNHGEDPHDLQLLKPSDSSLYGFPELGPELVARRTLSLSAGTWTLFCSISDHQARGMAVELVVD